MYEGTGRVPLVTGLPGFAPQLYEMAGQGGGRSIVVGEGKGRLRLLKFRCCPLLERSLQKP